LINRELFNDSYTQCVQQFNEYIMIETHRPNHRMLMFNTGCSLRCLPCCLAQLSTLFLIRWIQFPIGMRGFVGTRIGHTLTFLESPKSTLRGRCPESLVREGRMSHLHNVRPIRHFKEESQMLHPVAYPRF